MDVRSISAAETRGLRSFVLRPGQPPESLVYHGDELSASFHAGGYIDGQLVGIATVYPEPMPDPPADLADAETYRLRGMATHPSFQGRGVGREVLGLCLAHIREQGGEVLWCNARVGAQGFYERLGFETIGEPFEIEGIGPHYVMWRRV